MRLTHHASYRFVAADGAARASAVRVAR
jgi:hypothetical protein